MVSEVSHDDDEYHEIVKERSQALLCAAKYQANQQRPHGYRSSVWRAQVTTAFKQCFDNHTPHNWQLDVAEAVELGIDSILISSTGSGKTIPFILPLLLDKTRTKKVLIILPLLSLQEDQALKFTRFGLMAIAVNSETWGDELKKVCKRLLLCHLL